MDLGFSRDFSTNAPVGGDKNRYSKVAGNVIFECIILYQVLRKLCLDLFQESRVDWFGELCLDHSGKLCLDLLQESQVESSEVYLPIEKLLC